MIALAALKALAATGRFQRVFVLARKTAHGPAPAGLVCFYAANARTSANSRAAPFIAAYLPRRAQYVM